MIADAVPGARLEVVDGAAHFLHFFGVGAVHLRKFAVDGLPEPFGGFAVPLRQLRHLPRLDAVHFQHLPLEGALDGVEGAGHFLPVGPAFRGIGRAELPHLGAEPLRFPFGGETAADDDGGGDGRGGGEERRDDEKDGGRCHCLFAAPGFFLRREVQRHDVFILEIHAAGELDVLGFPRQFVTEGPLRLGNEGEAAAFRGGVADGEDAAVGQIGEEADGKGAVGLDVAAEGPGDEEFLHLVDGDAHFVHEHPHPGVDGAFGHLQLADILLADGDGDAFGRFLFGGEDELIALFPFDAALSEVGMDFFRLFALDVEDAAEIEDALVVELGDGVEEAAAAELDAQTAEQILLEVREEKIETQPSEPRSADADITIRTKDLWFRYSKDAQDVLRDLNLQVERGTLYSLLGGNGVGKSTLLKVLQGILKPRRGSVQISGRAAMLPQNPQALFSEITVEDDLLEALHYAEKTDEEKVAAVESMLQLLQIEHLRQVHPYDLSGGEQQRLALGKVLLLEPEILLLDEPTKGLDPFFKITLAEILKDLTAQGITVLMVSHDIEFCAEYADRCAMFFDGGIISEGEAESFFTGNNFYTTTANRIAREYFPGAITWEEVAACIRRIR